MNKLWRQFSLLAFLNYLDAILTTFVIRLTGPSGEGNAFGRYLIEHLGMGSIFILKSIVIGSWAIIILKVRDASQYHSQVYRWMVLGNAIILFVVIWDILNLEQMYGYS